jgi:hypothetical protein
MMAQNVTLSIKHKSTGIVFSFRSEAESRAAALDSIVPLLANPSDWGVLGEPATADAQAVWADLMPGYSPTPKQWQIWGNKYGPRTIHKAIQITADRVTKNVQDGIDFSTLDLVKYASAVMRNIEAEKED